MYPVSVLIAKLVDYYFVVFFSLGEAKFASIAVATVNNFNEA